MASGGKFAQAIMDQPGRIRDGNRIDIQVIFSLYRHEEFFYGEAGAKTVSGLCRVSDGSNVLDDLFRAGTPVCLSSDEVEVTVHFTSPMTFDVIGPVFDKG